MLNDTLKLNKVKEFISFDFIKSTFVFRLLLLIYIFLLASVVVGSNLTVPNEYCPQYPESKYVNLEFDIKSDSRKSLYFDYYVFEDGSFFNEPVRRFNKSLKISSNLTHYVIKVPVFRKLKNLRLDLGSGEGSYVIENMKVGETFNVDMTKLNANSDGFVISNLKIEPLSCFAARFIPEGNGPYFLIPQNFKKIKIVEHKYNESGFLNTVYSYAAVCQVYLYECILILSLVFLFILSLSKRNSLFFKLAFITVSIYSLCYFSISSCQSANDLRFEKIEYIYKIFHSEFFVIFLPVFSIVLASVFNGKASILKYLIMSFSLVFFSLIVCDLFSLTEFNTHFSINDALRFGGNTLDSKEIFISYLKGNKWKVFLIVITFIAIIKSCRIRNSLKVASVYTALTVLILSTYIILPKPQSTSWDEVFDSFLTSANVNANAHREYSDNYIYSSYTPDEKYVDGLNLRKNVIIIYTESLSSKESLLFNGTENNLKNLDKIAKENIYFKNYYTNAYCTDLSNYTFLTGKSYVIGTDVTDSSNYKYSFIKSFNNAGYDTSIVSSTVDFGLLFKVWELAQFKEFSGTDNPYYSNSERLTFNSVPDDDMFSFVLSELSKKRSDNPYLYMIMTTNTHYPFTVPGTHEDNYLKALKYVDEKIYEFYKKLNNAGFFNNGILIITGDHRAMIPYTSTESDKFNSMGKARVPLVIAGLNNEFSDTNEILDDYSHVSLGSLLEYINLDKAHLYDYQYLPHAFRKENLDLPLYSDTPVFYSDLYPRDTVYVRYKHSEYIIKLDGDDTHVEGSDVDLTVSEKLLKLLVWFRK